MELPHFLMELPHFFKGRTTFPKNCHMTYSPQGTTSFSQITHFIKVFLTLYLLWIKVRPKIVKHLFKENKEDKQF
jgi:hypothetical protein